MSLNDINREQVTNSGYVKRVCESEIQASVI